MGLNIPSLDLVTIGFTLTVGVLDTGTIEVSEEGREEEGIEVESKKGISVRVRLGKEGISGAGLVDTEEREVESTGKEDSTSR